MEHEILNWLASDDGAVVHLGVFVLLILGGLGFPIPEDIPILLAGVAGEKGIVRLHTIFLTSYVGVLLADQIVFLFGYYFGQRMLSAGTKSPFFPAITETRVQEIREGLRRRRLLYIFIGRHMFPVRSLTFLTAGSLRIPYLEFLLADAIAALISVGVVLILGYYLGGKLTPEMITHMAGQAHYYIFGIVLLCAIPVVLRLFLASRRRRREALAEAAAKPENNGATGVSEQILTRNSK